MVDIKNLSLLVIIITLIFLGLSFVSAAVTMIVPASNSNNSASTFFNVSYTNVTDLNSPVNATFYYNLSGTWTAIGNTSATGGCDGASCNITLDTSGLTDGFYSINASLHNGTDVAFATTVTTVVAFDNTVPEVYIENLTTATPGSNHSKTFFLNVSAVDVTAGVQILFFNITNSSGNQNATFTGVRTGTSDLFNVSINTSHFPDGFYNITIHVNDSASNSNITTTISNITFDNTVPEIFVANITAPYTGSNSSGELVFNISAVDAMAGIGTILINITNSTGAQNATYIAVREGTNPRYNITIDTSHFPDGVYNLTVQGNDSAGNINSTAFIPLVRFDNTSPTISFSCTPDPVEEDATITCTCSGTDANLAVNETTFTVNPTTAGTGTKSTTCTVRDAAGNTETATVNYLVEAKAGSSSSSGGGGSSTTTTTWDATFSITEDDFQAGHTRSVKEGQRLKVSVDSKDHYVGVKSVTATTAVIEVSSTPQEATFNIGETKKFEVSEDNYYDLSVTLDSITNNEAMVTILFINELIPATDPEQAVEETTEPAEEETPQLQPTTEGWSNSTVIISIIVIVLLGAVAWYFLRKKRTTKGL
jgi:hypothetical protein